jgi:hypothetical protein
VEAIRPGAQHREAGEPPEGGLKGSNSAVRGILDLSAGYTRDDQGSLAAPMDVLAGRCVGGDAVAAIGVGLKRAFSTASTRELSGHINREAIDWSA